MSPEQKLNRDRWVMLLLVVLVTLYWLLGLAYKQLKTEPYPALLMPDFRGTAGLEGHEYIYEFRELVVTTADGQTIRTPLFDALQRNGYDASQIPLMVRVLAPWGRDRQGTLWVRDQDKRLWEIARVGAVDDGPLDVAQVASVEVVLYRGRIDVTDWPHTEPVVARLASSPVTPRGEGP